MKMLMVDHVQYDDDIQRQNKICLLFVVYLLRTISLHGQVQLNHNFCQVKQKIFA